MSQAQFERKQILLSSTFYVEETEAQSTGAQGPLASEWWPGLDPEPTLLRNTVSGCFTQSTARTSVTHLLLLGQASRGTFGKPRNPWAQAAGQ